MSLVYSERFGGSPLSGSGATEPGVDCMVPIGPDPYVIERITATYAIAGAAGAGPPDYQSVRSFTGRLVVMDQLVTDQITLVGGVQPLSDLLPEQFRSKRLLFDVLLHNLGYLQQSNVFEFPTDPHAEGAITSLKGQAITAVLFAGATYSGGGVLRYNTMQMLHVGARPLPADSRMQIGRGPNALKARN